MSGDACAHPSLAKTLGSRKSRERLCLKESLRRPRVRNATRADEGGTARIDDTPRLKVRSECTDGSSYARSSFVRSSWPVCGGRVSESLEFLQRNGSSAAGDLD